MLMSQKVTHLASNKLASNQLVTLFKINLKNKKISYFEEL